MEKKTIATVAVVVLILIAAVTVVTLSKDNEDNSVVTVTDGLGREVTITSSDKIASTSLTVTEIICGLNGLSKLAGVTTDSTLSKAVEPIIGIPNDGYPGDIIAGVSNHSITDMGGMYMISAESILLASPDLVIMGGYFNSDNTISQLESIGIPVVVCKDDNSLENIYFNINLVGKVIGKTSEAQNLVKNMQSVIDKIVDWTESFDINAPSVAVFMGYGSQYGTYACGVKYIIGSPMIEMLGGTNAFSTISGMYEVVTTESIITANPDIIIDATPGSFADLNSIKTNPLTRGLPAVVNDAVYGTFDSCSTAFTMTTQSFVNSVALMAMFLYEDQLNFEINHNLGNDFTASLNKFWGQINS